MDPLLLSRERRGEGMTGRGWPVQRCGWERRRPVLAAGVPVPACPVPGGRCSALACRCPVLDGRVGGRPGEDGIRGPREPGAARLTWGWPDGRTRWRGGRGRDASLGVGRGRVSDVLRWGTGA